MTSASEKGRNLRGDVVVERHDNQWHVYDISEEQGSAGNFANFDDPQSAHRHARQLAQTLSARFNPWSAPVTHIGGSHHDIG